MQSPRRRYIRSRRILSINWKRSITSASRAHADPAANAGHVFRASAVRIFKLMSCFSMQRSRMHPRGSSRSLDRPPNVSHAAHDHTKKEKRDGQMEGRRGEQVPTFAIIMGIALANAEPLRIVRRQPSRMMTASSRKSAKAAALRYNPEWLLSKAHLSNPWPHVRCRSRSPRRRRDLPQNADTGGDHWPPPAVRRTMPDRRLSSGRCRLPNVW